jgi:hypothetical protein
VAGESWVFLDLSAVLVAIFDAVCGHIEEGDLCLLVCRSGGNAWS